MLSKNKNYTPLDIHRFNKPAVAKTGINPLQSAFFIALFFVSLSLTGFFFYQYQKSQDQLSKATLDNTEFIVDKVKKLTLVPNDETPSIATISRKDELPEQSFFQSAENGDKLLVYSKSKKAILYRPSLDKIVEVTSINFDSEVSGASTVNKPENDISPTPTEEIEETILYSPTQTAEPSPVPTNQDVTPTFPD